MNHFKITQLSAICLALILAPSSFGQITQKPTPKWEQEDTFVIDRKPALKKSMSLHQLQEAGEFAEAAGSDSLIVMRGGDVVYERYWNGKTRNDVQQMYSATKSPFAFVVYRAIQKGYIKSLDQPIVDFVTALKGKGREQLTFRNIMAMESGLAQTAGMDQDDGRNQRSHLDAALNREVTDPPFDRYMYNNAGYRTMFYALEKASGMSLAELTAQELFEPLGMEGAYWVELKKNGKHMGYQSIRMRPIDLAKVAQVMLNKGRWDGEQYIWRRFVKEMSTAPSAEANPSYGLFWHINRGEHFLSYAESDIVDSKLLPGTPDDAITNYGSGGQLVTAIPSLDLVWVRTGKNPPSTLWNKNGFVAQLSRAIVKAVEN
jgi:CubicO group peptidase (beta-lactamase class C family)